MHSARERKIELKQYKCGALSKTLMLGERHGHQRHQCMRLLILYFKTIKMWVGALVGCAKENEMQRDESILWWSFCIFITAISTWCYSSDTLNCTFNKDRFLSTIYYAYEHKSI